MNFYPGDIPVVDTRPTSWLPFTFVALALVAGTMGAAMASPLYPFYEQAWNISHGTITVIYVSYMLGVMAAFLLFGRISDHFGPVAVLRIALLLVLCGLGLSAAASGVIVLIVARVIIGVASGMISTAATIGLLALEPHGPTRRASLITSMTTMVGFGLGPFVAGLIAEFAPAPLITPYLAVGAPIIVILVALMLTPGAHHETRDKRLSFRPHLALPHADDRPAFLVASFAVFTAYALFSLLASLAPSFLNDLLPWRGAAISGTAIAVVLFCSAMVQFPARRLAPRICLRIALVIMTGGVLFLAAALYFRVGLFFVIADFTIGMGHGLSFMSALTLVNSVAKKEYHASILSTFFSIAYLGAVVPILAVGFVADLIGLDAAVVAFCAVAAVHSIFLLTLTGWALRRSCDQFGL